MMDIISSALDANQLASDECLLSTLGAQEQLQQCSSSLGIWRFKKKGWRRVGYMCDVILEFSLQVERIHVACDTLMGLLRVLLEGK